MIKKLSLLGTAVAMTATAVLPATAADAQYGRRYQGGYYEQNYDSRVYRGYDERNYYRPVKRCSDGTAGAIVGAIAGGLLGRVIDGRGDRAVGTILGAGGGALAGRAVERQGSKDAAYQGRCYR